MSHSVPSEDAFPRLSDSPWFWVCAFATAALVALFVMGPKYAARQSQLERQYQARQLSGHSVMQPGGTGPLSSRQRTIIKLRPLFLFLAAVLIVAWGLLLRNHRRAIRSAPPQNT
jgi:hypothetical protein